MKPCSVASLTVGWRSFCRDGQRTHKKRSKKLLNAQKNLVEKVFLEVFDGVPSAEVSKARFEEGLDMIAALAAETGFFASNGEARRELKQQSISVNKSKVGEDYSLSAEDLIASKYVLLQKGKKNYYLLKVV